MTEAEQPAPGQDGPGPADDNARAAEAASTAKIPLATPISAGSGATPERPGNPDSPGKSGNPGNPEHPGRAFGSGYLLQREIGVGGMGTVWRGWARARQEPVAIKILHPHLSDDRTVVNRFLREGDVLTRLDHPNLVKVHDLVVEGGRLGLVMDVIALRVDYGGSYSRTYYSSAFVPASSGTKTLTVTVGSWPSGQDITCEENVDPASDESDYEYGANSADIVT